MVEVRLEQLVKFDTSGWRQKPGGDPAVLIWMPPEGAGVGLYYVADPPALPRVATLAELRHIERQRLNAEGKGLVEHGVVQLRNCRAVRSVVKMPTDPTIPLARSGLTYIATLTLAFERIHFDIKTQAREVGPTGSREADVLSKAIQAGRVVPLGPGRLQGWIPIPGDGAGMLDANLAEDPEHDATFPTHPLSKVRAILDRVQATVVINELLYAEAQFPLPGY